MENIKEKYNKIKTNIEILDFLISKCNFNEQLSDIFWIRLSRFITEKKYSNICIVSLADHGVVFPQNINKDIRISQKIIKKEKPLDMYNSILYSLNKENVKGKFYDLIICTCPYLSVFQFLNEDLMSLYKISSGGNIINSFNIFKSDENEVIRVHEEDIYFNEFLIKAKLHDFGFKRVFRFDKMETLLTIKHEKNGFVEIEKEDEREISKYYKHNMTFEPENKMTKNFTILCDMGITI